MVSFFVSRRFSQIEGNADARRFFRSRPAVFNLREHIVQIKKQKSPSIKWALFIKRIDGFHHSLSQSKFNHLYRLHTCSLSYFHYIRTWVQVRADGSSLVWRYNKMLQLTSLHIRNSYTDLFFTGSCYL